MHSIELLLDDASDEAVRSEWRALADAGLPSQARHTGETNAPHITLVARREIGAEHDDRLRDVAAALPVGAELGGLVVFGAPPRGLVLARLAVVTRGLLSLHEAVHRAVAADDADDAPHTRPGRWTPHVTLASRLTPGELAAALDTLDAHRRASAAAGALDTDRASDSAEATDPDRASDSDRSLDSASSPDSARATDSAQAMASAQAVALRRWDSTARTVTPLRPAP